LGGLGLLGEVIPKALLDLPVGLTGDLSKFVFGNFRETFVLTKQDLFLDGR